MTDADWIAIFLASAVPIVLAGALINRCIVTHVHKETKQLQRGRGMGWQFVRFCVLVTAIPVVGLLALKSMISGEVAVGFFGAALGYVFGKVTA